MDCELAGARMAGTFARNSGWNFPHTDLLRAFLLASQQFAATKRGYRNVLIIFSDMRHKTGARKYGSPAAVRRIRSVRN